MSEYKGEQVLAQNSARLLPFGDKYPDCQCELILTPGHLYAVEDNFDGTWTEQIVFPISQVVSIEKKKEETTALDARDARRSGGIFTAMVMAMGIMSGGVAYYKEGPAKKEKAKYIEVRYQVGDGRTDVVHFGELEGNVSGFIEAFQSIKWG